MNERKKLVLKLRFKEMLDEKYPEGRPTQLELADAIGISQPTVSSWLAGHVTRFDKTTLENVCEFLQCDVGELLYMEEVSKAG